jgi:hypothetical protein
MYEELREVENGQNVANEMAFVMALLLAHKLARQMVQYSLW